MISNSNKNEKSTIRGIKLTGLVSAPVNIPNVKGIRILTKGYSLNKWSFT
jgi:hypothetical protein